MAKDFHGYKGELSVTRDKYHCVILGNLFLLFEPNHATILPGHESVIKDKVVDFLVRAVRALGPDAYNLSVLGMASATGTHHFNADLAGRRAYNAAMCAIRHFEKIQKGDATLAGATINPATSVLADDLARIDVSILHLKRSQVESQQGIFRSAVFKFTAGRLEDRVKHSPSFVCSGPEAARRANELLARSEPEMGPYSTPWGPLHIRKGEVWRNTKRLVVSADWQHVTYLEGDTLWSARTADFAREIVLDGMIDGMHRARPLVRLTHITMGFIQGLLVGPFEAMASKLIVLFMWAGAHPHLVQGGYDAAGPAFRGLRYLHDRCPTLWDKVVGAIEQQAGREIVDALQDTVTKPENIAFFLGRIAHGVGSLDSLFYGKAKPGKRLVEVSVGKIIFVTVKTAAIVTALHLPEGMAAVTEKNIARLAKDLQPELAKLQIVLSDPEAKKIAEELLGPGVKAELEKLQQPLKSLQNALNTLVQDMEGLN